MLDEKFRDCKFIAGSADVEWEIRSDLVMQSLQLLSSYARNPIEPNVIIDEKLAHLLHAMIAVAKADYAADGFAEYWPFLECHLNEVPPPEGFGKSQISLDGNLQRQLGGLFLYSLNRFELINPEMGLRYVGPIAFHAGLPDSSVDNLVKLVLSVVDDKGREAPLIPFSERCRIVKDFVPQVHKSVQSIFALDIPEVKEFWQSLVRVAFSWSNSDDCSRELQELPPFVNPEKVYECLVNSSSPTVRAATTFSRPEFSYDPSDGHIRILLKSDHWQDPSIKHQNNEWSQRFRHAGNYLESICYKPLPECLIFTSSITNSYAEIHLMSDERRGIWFDGKSGRLVTADQVDRYGLTPGTWYLIIRGNPIDWNIQKPIRQALSWSFYQDGQDWTAWELEIPTWSSNRPLLKFKISDIQEPTRISLAKQAGPRFEFATQTVCYATNDTSGRFAVFSSKPEVRNNSGNTIPLRVWKWVNTEWSLIGDLNIPANSSHIQISHINDPGCYRLTEKRGIGREITRLAYIPDLIIENPKYDDSKSNVTITTKIDARLGKWKGESGIEIRKLNSGLTEIQSTTIEPKVIWTLQWDSENQPSLTFNVDVEGVRWRVTGLTKANDTDHPAPKWTTDTIHLTKQEGMQSTGLVEVQYPVAEKLTLAKENYANEKFTNFLPSGKLWSERLTPFVADEMLTIRIGERDDFVPVVISDRPRLGKFNIT